MEIKYFAFLKYIIRFNRHVYLDHNATTPVSSHVQRKMEQALKFHYGNPSSFYGIGRKSAEVLEEARGHACQTRSVLRFPVWKMPD